MYQAIVTFGGYRQTTMFATKEVAFEWRRLVAREFPKPCRIVIVYVGG